MPRRVLPSLFVLAVASSACAFDYLVRPVPPETTQDAATSVFPDFRSKAPGADGVKLDPVRVYGCGRLPRGGDRPAGVPRTTP